MTSPALDIADQADDQVQPLVPLRRNLQFQTLCIGSLVIHVTVNIDASKSI